MESVSAPQSTKIGEETPYLPEQLIIEEILPRLQVKALLKFRCVSKSWCSLIGSNRFIKDHLKRSIESSRFPNNCIFDYVDYAGKQFKGRSVPSVFYKLFAHPISHIAGLGLKNLSMIDPVGCCHGLVCVHVNSKRFILWNPITKKFKSLPNPIQGNGGYNGIAIGFGFDELSDDYKVFATIVSSVNCVGMIYSLRSNSWKPIEETDRFSQLYGLGMYVSGKLHWCHCLEESPQDKCDIVSFDLNSHVYGVVELPSYAEGVRDSVGVIGGCLGALFIHPNKDLDVWVMKEYGVKESWDKVATLPYNMHRVKESWAKVVGTLPYNMHLDIPAPVATGPNGKVLLNCISDGVVYNPKCCEQFLAASPNEYPDDEVRSMGIYTESLVAPDS